MGQGTSVEDFIPHTIDSIQDDVARHIKNFSEVATISYDDFVGRLGELNILSKKCLDKNGKQLVFAIQKGTDSTILWRGTVRIICVKVDPVTYAVENYRFISLVEFFKIFKTLKDHMHCMAGAENDIFQAGPSSTAINQSDGENLTMSMLIERVRQDNLSNAADKPPAECCICLERSPEVILPCAHSYCLPCIERWNVNNKTCPICREKLETTDDTWVISEAPNAEEIAAEITATLHGLSNLSSDTKPKS